MEREPRRVRDDIKTRSLKGLVWATGESFGVALISLGSFVVLARLLSPQDFGIVALATVFVYFCNVLTGHSFADVVVQRPEMEGDHLDTAFWSTLAIASALAAACLAGAGTLSLMLGEPALAGALRWLSLVPPLSALSSVQMALLRRGMRFDVVARVSLLGRAIGAMLGIGMALAGFGFWSLIGQQLAGQAVMTAVFAAGPWRPRFRFSAQRLREMWAFGAQVSLNQVVTGATEQTFNLLIGTFFGATVLGYFTLAWRAVQLVKSLISSAVYHVGLSAFSRLQQDRQALVEAFLNATRISCLVGFPIAIGIALVAEPLVVGAFDEQWRRSIPLLSLMALELIPTFYGVFLSALYRAMDRAAWGLAMAVAYAVVGLGGALAVAPYGIEAMVAVWVGRAFLLMPLHVMLLHRLLAVPYKRLAGPVVAPLAATAVMAGGLAVMGLALPALPPLATLVLLAAVGAIVYAAGIRLVSPPLFGLALRTAGRAVASTPKAP